MVAETAVWRDRLTAQERAQLGRGAGVIEEQHPDVLVVGGGIAGVATAAACHAGGLGSVLLIEAGRLGSGATGGAAGLLTPEIHEWSDPEPFVELARASLELWGELEQTWPDGVGLIELDWIGLAPDPDGFAPHQRPAVEWLDHDQVAELVPGLARPMAGALIRRQARVNPLRSLARLAAVLPAVATGTAATSVEVKSGRVVRSRRPPETSTRARSCSPPGCLRCSTACRWTCPPAGSRATCWSPSPRRYASPARWRRWPPSSMTAGSWSAAPSTPVTKRRRCGRTSSTPSWRRCTPRCLRCAGSRPTISGAVSGPGTPMAGRSSTGFRGSRTPG